MRAKAYKLVTRINYRRNTTGKAGCICSERRENVACFVFELRMWGVGCPESLNCEVDVRNFGGFWLLS